MPYFWKNESECKYYVKIPLDREGKITFDKMHVKDYDQEKVSKNAVIYIKELEKEIEKLKGDKQTVKYYYAKIKPHPHPLLRDIHEVVIFCPKNDNGIYISNDYVDLQDRYDAKHLTFKDNCIKVGKNEIEKVDSILRSWESKGIITFSEKLFNLAKDFYIMAEK